MFQLGQDGFTYVDTCDKVGIREKIFCLSMKIGSKLDSETYEDVRSSGTDFNGTCEKEKYGFFCSKAMQNIFKLLNLKF